MHLEDVTYSVCFLDLARSEIYNFEKLSLWKKAIPLYMVVIINLINLETHRYLSAWKVIGFYLLPITSLISDRKRLTKVWFSLSYHNDPLKKKKEIDVIRFRLSIKHKKRYLSICTERLTNLYKYLDSGYVYTKIHSINLYSLYRSSKTIF